VLIGRSSVRHKKNLVELAGFGAARPDKGRSGPWLDLVGFNLIAGEPGNGNIFGRAENSQARRPRHYWRGFD